jgi:hypothetical protein
MMDVPCCYLPLLGARMISAVAVQYSFEMCHAMQTNAGGYDPIRLFVTAVADETSIDRLPDLASDVAPLTVGQHVVLQK